MAVAALDHFFFSFEIPSMESQVFSPNKITQYTLHISHLVIFSHPKVDKCLSRISCSVNIECNTKPQVVV